MKLRKDRADVRTDRADAGMAKCVTVDDLMKYITLGDIVIIMDERDSSVNATGTGWEFREEDALFNDEVQEWYKHWGRWSDVGDMRITGVRSVELEDTAGPVIMIQAERWQRKAEKRPR